MVTLLAVLAVPASAVNTRVSIADFRWSQTPTVDLGETVIWDWLGPDTQHSITGQPPNASQWDSDPQSSMPIHTPGDSYSLTFDQPGEYLFVCKVHSSVRGTVTVSDQPGNPNSDPGPQPPVDFDYTPPTMNEIDLDPDVLGPKGKGAPLDVAIDELGVADADYYKLIKRGRKTIRMFMGYSRWDVHVGYNRLRFAARTATFKPKPGKYEALVRVTDESFNVSDPTPIKFEIKSPKKKKGKRTAKAKALKKCKKIRKKSKRDACIKRVKKKYKPKPPGSKPPEPSEPSEPPPVDGDTRTVGVVDDKFEPDDLTIKAGDSIDWVWSNDNANAHNVTFVDGPGNLTDTDKYNLTTPNSPSVQYSFKRRLSKAGTYDFICTLHSTVMNMKVNVTK